MSYYERRVLKEELLLNSLQKEITKTTEDDPETFLYWTIKNTREISQLLAKAGYAVSLVSRWTFRIRTEGFRSSTLPYSMQSHNDIINGIYEDVRYRTPIKRHMIRSMHAMFTEFQDYCPGIDPLGRRVWVPLRKGLFKIFPNNPVRPDGLIHEYCPPPYVDYEIDNLLCMHDEHVAKSVPVDVEAAWFHHCFVQIHPFQDGNGRMARSFTSLIAGYLPPVVTLKGKPDYRKALDIADQGDLKPFVDCLASLVWKKDEAMLKAVSRSQGSASRKTIKH
jgi:Fic family protein